MHSTIMKQSKVDVLEHFQLALRLVGSEGAHCTMTRSHSAVGEGAIPGVRAYYPNLAGGGPNDLGGGGGQMTLGGKEGWYSIWRGEKV